MTDNKLPFHMIHLLNDAADIVTALTIAGLEPDAIMRIVRGVAEVRLTARPAVAVLPEPEYGWHDGLWMRTDHAHALEQEMLMRVSNMYPSKWLAAADLEDRDWVVTIAGLKEEEVTQTETKWVVYFEELDKGLVLNKTNTKMLAQLLGDETDDWIGRKISLFPTQVDFQGEQVDAIRVRKKLPRTVRQPAAAGKVEPMTQEEADDDEIPF